MKTIKLTLIMLFISLVIWNNATSGNVAGKSETTGDVAYTMVKDMSGIRIFTRWIPIDESRSGKEVKAEFVVEGTVETVLSVLRDDRSFTAWMNGTKEYYRIKTVDAREWYSYMDYRSDHTEQPCEDYGSL